jgi:hypothetical protein
MWADEILHPTLHQQHCFVMSAKTVVTALFGPHILPVCHLKTLSKFLIDEHLNIQEGKWFLCDRSLLHFPHAFKKYLNVTS